ncbi:MAG: L-threonate dehydrogenase [Granulosicoccus sp.]
MTATKNVAVIGLGSMGYGIAQSILREGHTVYGFDVNEQNVQRFKTEGGAAGDLTDIASTLDIVLVCVLNAAQTESVLFADETPLVSTLAQGTVVIACATVPPEFARNMAARCEKHKVSYLDAPMSGGSKKASNGQLTYMASGSELAFEQAQPALDASAQTVFNLGNEAGAGSAMKAVNQMLAGVHIAIMAEAVTFGMTQGVKPKDFLEIISQCAGTSWMLENRAPHIVDGDYTPHSSIDIWPKDLGIVMDIAHSAKFSAPITAAALQQFVAASGSGLGQEDDAAVAKVYARNAGLELP